MSLDKDTMKLENKFIKELEFNYKATLRSIRNELFDFYDKYAQDGVITPVIAARYDRLAKLEKSILAELKTLEANREVVIKEYLYGVYELNFTGVESLLNSKGIDTAFGVLNKRAIKESLLTPFDKIALEDNAQKVIIGIKRNIAQGITQGLSVRDMSKLVEKTLESNANNATRIVRTETTGIMNKARSDAFQEASGKGVEIRKRWVATNDGRTRDTHAAQDGEVVKEGERFSNGLLYPGDQAGDASEVINCRCSLASEIYINGEKV